MADSIKAELESKRQKLNRIREEKLRRAAVASSIASGTFVGSSIPSNQSITSVVDIEEIFKSLGIDSQSAIVNSPAFNSESKGRTDALADQAGESRRRDKRKLKAIFNALKVDIPPDLSKQVYTKETQTITSDYETNEALQWDDDEMFAAQLNIAPFHRAAVNSMDHITPSAEEATTASDLMLSTTRDHYLSAEDRDQLMNSSQFMDFLGRSGRALERMLASSANNGSFSESGAFVNYRNCMGDRRFSDEEEFTDSEDECKKLMRQVHVIHEPGHDDYQGASINSVDWCPSKPELLLAAYGDVNENGGHKGGQHNSRVLIWNQRHGGVKNPEFTLNCYQSPVTCSIFSPYHRYLVYGGTYSGQIVIWDLRTGKSGPVQRSLPSGAAHQHPVYALRTVGSSENAYSLISVSSDGKMCTWRPDMVAKPSQEAISLLYKQTIGVATTCLDFPASGGGDVNKFVVGSDEYNIYVGLRHGSSEKNAGVTGSLEGHRAQVTSISCHPHIEWSNLLLSSSLDCTIGLWSLSEMTQIASLTSEVEVVSECRLMTLSAAFRFPYKHVLDVKWARNNPAVLACSTSGGRVSIWDLSRNTELPKVTQCIGYPAKRLAWQHSGSQGRTHLAVGTEVGSLHLFSVSDGITQTRADTVPRFNLALKDIRSRHCADR